MGSEWPIGRLGDYVDACLGKMLDKEKNRGEYSPYLGNKNVRWGTFDLNDLAEMRFEEHENDRYGLQSGDLIICEGGEPGRCAIWTEEVPNMKIQKALHRVRPREGLNNYYLHYWFTWAGQNGLLDAYFTGTTIKHLTGKALASLEVPIPPMKSQEGMVKILKSLDDKIALNRQINTTLESMAQALFKSWFVDFDPVIDNALAAGNEIPDALQKRAARREALRQQSNKTANETSNKTTGATDADSVEQALPETGLSDPRLPSEIQQLFPDRFVFTEDMGWVPEGWGVEPLDKIANYQNGLAMQKFRPEDENDFLPVVKIAQLKKGYADGEEKASPNIKPECIIDDGDVVFSWSGSLMVDIWCGGRAALNQHLFKVTSDEYPKWFFLQLTLHHLAEFQRIAADKAVTMGHIKREHLSQAKCSVPGMDFMEKLSPFFDPLLNKAVLSRLENRALVDLRDSLLPKLLSGQITIPDAEQQLAEVL